MANNVAAVRAALEAAGVDFLPDEWRRRGREAEECRKMNELFCDYSEGMFAIDERKPEIDVYRRVVEFHEAGHAVVGYALGLGCTSIIMRETYHINEKMLAIHGVAYKSKESAKKGTSLLKKGVYSPILEKIGIGLAAGAAAERRYCFENNIGLRTLMGTANDHDEIDRIGKRLEMVGDRDSLEFQDIFWRRAQTIINNAQIWAAINEIAEWLDETFAPCPPDDDDVWGDHSNFDIMPGPRARAVMRRFGVNPGMFAGPCDR